MARCDWKNEAIRLLFYPRRAKRQRAAPKRAYGPHPGRNSRSSRRLFSPDGNLRRYGMTAASASAPALERRRERRLPIHLPIVVRGTDCTGLSFEERTSSENLCRGGAAFATRYPLDLGTQLEIHIPVLPAAASE